MTHQDQQAPAAGENSDVEVSAGVALSPPSDKLKLLATARLILARRHRTATVAPPAKLWPAVIADVRALSLETAQEASLASACYALLFGGPQEW